MAIKNAAIFAQNWVIDGGITASSWLGEHHPKNLKSSIPGRIYRSEIGNSHIVSGDFGGEVRSVDAFSIGGHNLPFDAQVVLRLYYFNSLIDEIIFDGIEPIYGLGEGPIDWNIGGYGKQQGQKYIKKSFDSVSASRYEIEITTTEDFNFEAAYLYIGEGFMPKRNVARTPEINVVDPTEWIETEGRSIRPKSEKVYRTLAVSWEAITSDEASQFLEIVNQIGKRQIVLVMLEPESQKSISNYTAFLAWMEWQPIVRRKDTQDELYTLSVNLREAI